MKRFLVTGLPRSRTAWLAALLTAHSAFCLHEVEVTFPALKDLGDVFKAGYLGISDPSIFFRHREQVREWFGKTGCPMVVIDRPSDEAKAAFEKVMGRPEPNWNALVDSIARFREEFNPLVVDYRLLDNRATVHRVVEHLTAFPLDGRIFDLFTNLKIEQHHEKVRAVI